MDGKMKTQGNEENERISALADGQLSRSEFALALEDLEQTDGALVAWRTYHVVGEVLRGGSQALSQPADANFWKKIEARLNSDADSGSIPEEPILGRVPPSLGLAKDRDPGRVTDSLLAWKYLAGFAVVSFGVVLVIGQLAKGLEERSLDRAASPFAASVDHLSYANHSSLALDPRLDQLLAEHRQFGGVSAFQRPTGFLRNATFAQAAP